MSDEVFLATVARFNERRDFSTKAFKSTCYAPYVSMYLDQHGDVRVCCQNVKYTVGNIARQSLDEIWNGARINKLRSSVRNCDLRNGCDFCEWQFLEGNDSGDFIRLFDNYSVSQEFPAYPKLMEFSISNTCNLECVMCNGEWSSSIRTKREKRKPIPKVYGDAFFEQLRPYLPHLEKANFYGGEPFLEHEAFRIWNMMIEMNLNTCCCATTNGTQYNAKVERVIHSLPFQFNISIEGVTKETVEKIRKNSIYEVVMANFKKFHAYAKERKSHIGFTTCLMTLNWHEFGDLLLFADDWDVSVYVNTVTKPTSLSLYHLPPEELAAVVKQMQSKDGFYRQRLGKNRDVWINEFNRLQNAVENFEESREHSTFWGATLEEVPEPEVMSEEQAKSILKDWSEQSTIGSARCDKDLRILNCDFEILTQLKLRNEELIGGNLSEVQRLLVHRHGPDIENLKSERNDTYYDDLVLFRSDPEHSLYVRAISIPQFDENKEQTGLNLFVGTRTTPEPVLVSIEL